ncbi:hypothetical protein OFC21_05270 [Escherichia coli]|nr:hypothetical protein [Escherichia coli]
MKASHPALIAGCSVNALSGLHLATAVGLIRRDSVASGIDYQMQPTRGLISQAK